MDTAALDIRPKIWRRYIDNSFKVVQLDKWDELTEHLNTINITESIKFIDKSKQKGSIPLLDACISCKDDRVVKVWM